ncbi:MAG: hypothetical protein ACREMR_06670 [Gemmatimonadales bacterium]
MVRLGCLLVALAGISLAWWYRAPIVRTAARWVGPGAPDLPPVADVAVGAPTPRALASGQAKLRELARDGGPDSVVLDANEAASLVGGGIDWSVRKTFDSLRVELLDGALALHARLDTRQLPREVVGPLGGVLEPREALRLSGPIVIERPGIARWSIRELSLRGVAFPAPVVRQLARRAAGADGAGAVPIQVDRAIAEVSVHPVGVVLYRRRRT